MKKHIRDSIDFELGTVLHIERQIDGKSIRGTSKILGAHDPRYLIIDQPFAYGKPMFSTAGEECIVRFLHHGSLLGFRAEIAKIHFDPFPMILVEYPREIEEMALRKHDRMSCRFEAQATIEPPKGAELKERLAKIAKAGNSKLDGMAALVAQDMDDNLPLTPDTPLRTTIVDMAEGGCQLAILVFDPQNFSERALEARKSIPVGERANYHARSLRLFCAQGRTAKLTFDLPQPGPGSFIDVNCQVRWNKTFGDYFLAGLSFEGEYMDLNESIRKIIDHQNKYFSNHYDSEA